ncbi:MAG TPA: peptidylprolyl isomerase [Nocardioides sp.]|nr:peptidylprolyl isomerase [Nocardioides sp.]
MRSRLLAGVPALILLASFSACNDDDPTATDDNTPSDAPTSGGTSAAGGTACNFVETGGAAREVELPAATTDLSGEVPAVLHTSIGDLKVALDADKAPCTVASFSSLAEQGYYDNTSCHRQGNDPGFEFLQCGDPYYDPEAETQDPAVGTGNPGYTIPDEIDGTETYEAGTLAMANTGVADSGGGQFFIVFGDSQFPPSYTVWGHLDAASIALVKKAAASGNDGSSPAGGGAPNTPVTFESIDIG